MTEQRYALFAQHFDVEQAMAEVAISYDRVIDNKTRYPITVDCYSPASTQAKRPVMVFLHGGSWSGGSKSQFDNQALYFASQHGFYTLSVDYCLSGDLPFPAAIEDSKTVVRWLKAHGDELNIDVDSIVLAGASAGANIAAIHLASEQEGLYRVAGLYDGYDSDVQAAILLNGEYDMWDLIRCNSLVDGISRFVASVPDARLDLIDAVSPLQHINGKMPPTLLLHGDEDPFVSHRQSIDFADKLTACGVYAEVEVIAGKRHNWFNEAADFMPTIHRIEAFIAALKTC